MITEIKRFNVRVYGLLLNDNREILLSTERRGDFHFTKFPGGGLELGEGTKDCLMREFKEELGIEIELKKHFYTTDFFQRSAFRNEEQIIKNGMEALDREEGNKHHFYWKRVEDMEQNDLTFPIDRLVLSILKR